MENRATKEAAGFKVDTPSLLALTAVSDAPLLWYLREKERMWPSPVYLKKTTLGKPNVWLLK
jgi:hypothetical protein